jgi:YVTN family beta-propeller protein
MPAFLRHGKPGRGRTKRLRLIAVPGGGAALALCASGAYALVSQEEHAGPQRDGTAVTSTGWKVTPVGKQITLGERPYGLTRSPDGRTLLVSNDGVAEQSMMVLDGATGEIRQTIRYEAPEALFLGIAYSPDGRHAYASGGQNDEIHTYDVQSDGTLAEGEPLSLATADDDGNQSHPFPAGLTVSADNQTLYVADHLANAMSIVDIANGEETRIPLSDRTCTITSTGDASRGRDCQFPYGVTLSGDGSKAYVSDWGQSNVSVVDLVSAKVAKTVQVGTHPSAMALSPTRAHHCAASVRRRARGREPERTRRVR